MNAIRFDPSAITFASAHQEAILAQTALCTKFGLIAAAPRDIDAQRLAVCRDIVGRLDAAGAGCWAERPSQESAHALASRTAALPRAVLWSALVRASVGARLLDACAPLDVAVATELGDAASADALRACALAGLTAASLNGAEILPPHDDILRWQQRKPWARLKSATTGETLVADPMRLPASARFGRRYVAFGDAADAQHVALALGDETLAVEMPDSSEFPGQQEFELVWGEDGRVALDLLVDGDWRPLGRVAPVEPRSERNRAAAEVFRQLSEWREVASLIQVHVFEPIEGQESP